MLTAMLEPLCDVSVRCELRARRALAEAEPTRAFTGSDVFSPAVSRCDAMRIRSDQIRSDQMRSDQIRSDQIRSDQMRSDQIRCDAIR